MTNIDFLGLLEQSTTMAYGFARQYVTNDLPASFQYDVILNASADDPGLTGFDIYPDDNGKKITLIDSGKVVELLCRKNKIPVWIDISVDRIHKGSTVFRLLCAGRYTDNELELYYRKNGTGPFGIKSPTLPPGYIAGQQFKIKEKNSIINWIKKYFIGRR